MPSDEASNLYHLYQPIVALKDKRIIGVEALMRGEREGPESLIAAARGSGTLFELDTNSILRAVRTYAARPNPAASREVKLFVNVFPSTLLHADFGAFLDVLHARIRESNLPLVLELNETSHESELWEAIFENGVLDRIRDQGIMLAFDDFGEGSITLKHLIHYRPDFLKLSKLLSASLHVSDIRQRIVKCCLVLCGEETAFIVEGVEERSQLDMLQHLQIEFAQGYYFSRPVAIDAALNPRLLI